MQTWHSYQTRERERKRDFACMTGTLERDLRTSVALTQSVYTHAIMHSTSTVNVQCMCVIFAQVVNRKYIHMMNNSKKNHTIMYSDPSFLSLLSSPNTHKRLL